MSTPIIHVVDLFAGPGGLGEGFSAFQARDGTAPFRISLSIEKDPIAATTLSWRAFTRGMYARGVSPARIVEALTQLPQAVSPAPGGRLRVPTLVEQAAELDLGREWNIAVHDSCAAARAEACLHELGVEGRAWVNTRLASIERRGPIVLIGGPPCQAYSLAGRSRNRGKQGYVAREDHRHFLYREYLHVLRCLEPDVFVMENVKGILSATVDDAGIFDAILSDLQDPSRAMDGTSSGARYKIYALPTGEELVNSKDAIVRMEHWGIPQRRHRVILLGVRSDISIRPTPLATNEHYGSTCSLRQALAGLPPLRSGLSKEVDDSRRWQDAIREFSHAAWTGSLPDAIRTALEVATSRPSNADRGSNIAPSRTTAEEPCHKSWYYAHPTGYVLNHDTREHMRSDLARYLFSSVYAATRGQSPKIAEFPEALLPEHKNVHESNDPPHKDRFKVQSYDAPSLTVTSHISKDGHYFIHPDPTQCRSLTVREAARLQTFPDDYFFCGPRTERYHQVGNAVPPLLARHIAEVVHRLLVGEVCPHDSLESQQALFTNGRERPTI